MADLQQELAECKKRAEQGQNIANESFKNLKDALREERKKLEAAERQQNNISRLENDEHFNRQMKDMEKLEKDFISKVDGNLENLSKNADKFTIIVYGRTTVGKSTFMEILTHGDGSHIGKGAQRTTRDVRPYEWNGLKFLDVPGVGAYDGSADDKVAYEAAKTADLALFLMENSGVQPVEAAELHKLKELGKPILGVVNVKQGLAPANTPQRKINLKQIEKAMNDKQKLEELVQQFRDFAAIHNDNFDDIPFVYSHLQSAFFAQRENDESLRQLSNFDAVENFILEKFKSDGRFIRIKTFIDAVAEPMQKATSQLYSHSAGSVQLWKSYKDKVKELNKWHKSFFDRTQNRYNEFMSGLEDDINGKINYVVNNYYDSEYAGDHWKDAITALGISRRCENFIRSISEEATKKLRALADNLTQDLRYSGAVNVEIIFSGRDTDDSTRDFLMTAAPLLAFTPVGWLGAAAVGIGSWLFGDSKETKIRNAKRDLREKLEESRDEIMAKTSENVLKLINEKILHGQIAGFRDKLFEMQDMIADLAYSQNIIADTVNRQYKNLNWELLNQAGEFLKLPYDEIYHAELFRNVGNKILLMNETNMSEDSRIKLEKLISEKFEVYKVSSEYHYPDVLEYFREKIDQFQFVKFVEDENNGDMYIILLLRSGDYKEEDIQFLQQATENPVVLV